MVEVLFKIIRSAAQMMLPMRVRMIWTDGVAWRVIWVATKVGYSVVCMFAVVVGMIWYFQEKLLFHPHAPSGLETPDRNPKPYQNPEQMKMLYEDVWLKTKDDCKLHAWFIKQKPPQDYRTAPTLIFFQGNAGNMGIRLSNIQKLYQLCNVNIFAVSYRGYGYSTGNPTEAGLYTDAEAALDHLLSRKDIDTTKIMVFGRSIGGAVALDLASKRFSQLRSVIVENTFTSLRDMVVIVFPFLKPFSFVIAAAQRLFMDSLSKVPLLPIPVMYISGLKDTLVPPSHVSRLYNSTTSSPLRYLYPVTDGTHNDTWQQGDAYYHEISHFIAKALQTLPPASSPMCPATELKGSLPVTSVAQQRRVPA